MAMQKVTEIFRLGYYGFFDKYGDPRVRDRFLLKDPAPVLGILTVYLLFCLKLGPMWMERRKAFDLKPLLLVYNFIIVVGSAIMIYEGFNAGFSEYSLTCEPVDYSDDLNAVKMTKVGHMYFIFKVLELMDTVFFVLRKKTRQITFLHVYHHTFMCLLAWIISKFYAGGHTAFPACINTIVHVVMYSYYLLAALGPRFQKYLWWKKYLTKFQLIQFGIIILHQSQVLFNGCDIPKFIPSVCTAQAFLFMYLFADFYFSTYSPRTKPKDNK